MKYFFYWLILFFSVSGFAGSKSPGNLQIGKTVELSFFWSHRCPHCLKARPFIETLAAKYTWLKVNSYDLIDHPDNVRRYLEMTEALNAAANSVPAFIFCDQMLVGYDNPTGIGQILEQRLIACHQDIRIEQEETVLELPIVGKIDYQDFSLPVLTLLIASLDAFNPCAFFVLLFLLSLMVHTRDRMRITVIGVTFVLFSGIMYFLFMAAWLNLFLLTKQLAMITVGAGLIAVIIGLINIKDYFFFQQGISLSIPESAKPKLFERIRNLVQAGQWPTMIAATMVLAIVANSYELLCTAGLPMVYTRILTLQPLSNEHYYLYLTFYNLIYVVPLFLIVVVYTWTLGSKKLSERQGRLLKLLSGLMMSGLGGMLLLAPELLNNMLASVSILGAAIALTLLCYFSERLTTSGLSKR
jgi:thiol-disulfide isomerase/thioredoxin